MTDPAEVIRETLRAFRLWPENNPREFGMRGRALGALAALEARVRELEAALKEAEAREHLANSARVKAEAERDRLREAANVAIGNLTVPGWIAPSAHITHAVAVLREALADVPAGDKPKISTSGNTATNLILHGAPGEPWDKPQEQKP